MWQYHRAFLNNISEIFHTVFVLKLVFLQCFRIIKGLFYRNVERRIRQKHFKTFIQHFVNVIFNISLQLSSDVSQIFHRMCS